MTKEATLDRNDNLTRAAEAVQGFDELAKKEFGACITTQELIVPTITNDELYGVANHPKVPNGLIIPLGRNFDKLTSMVTNGLGLLMDKGEGAKLYPAVITSRTTADALSLSYLEDEISPTNIPRELTRVQYGMLNGSIGIQDKRVGTQHSHNTVAKTATEIGHASMALRALTDRSTRQAIQRGAHIVHDWGNSAQGIVPNLTRRDARTPGGFDMQTENGERRLSLPSIELRANSPVALVRHPAFELPSPEDLAIDPSKLVFGIGLIAAQQYFGSEGALQDQMLRNMDAI